MRISNGLALALIMVGSTAFGAADAVALAKLVGIKDAGSGQVMNACDEAVVPTVTPIEFGGAVGTAQLLVIPGGPNQMTCYGDNPGEMFLLMADGAGFKTVFNGMGFVTVLPKTHKDVHDFALGGPGFTFPVYVWNGKEFAQKGEISDKNLQTLGDLPSYP
jgi:hypothetical protein